MQSWLEFHHSRIIPKHLNCSTLVPFCMDVDGHPFMTDIELESMLELDSVLERVHKMKELQELFDEIPREGGRAVITLGIIPLLQHTENVERFLERHDDFASEFGAFARMAVYLADLYLFDAGLGPIARKMLRRAIDRFEDWLLSMSRRRLISYHAGERPPPYVEPGVDPSTEDLREVLGMTFHGTGEVSNGFITGGALFALVTAPTRQLAVLGFVPADAESAIVENLIRTQRYAAAVFRLFFRHPQKMHFEDAERKLVIEYIQRILRESEKVDNWEAVAEALERLQEWKRERQHGEL